MHTPSDRHSGMWEDHVSCSRCDAKIHPECYWGRVVSLAEFQAWRRHVAGGPEDYQGPPMVCAQCRGKGEPSPGVVPLRQKGA